MPAVEQVCSYDRPSNLKPDEANHNFSVFSVKESTLKFSVHFLLAQGYCSIAGAPFGVSFFVGYSSLRIRWRSAEGESPVMRT